MKSSKEIILKLRDMQKSIAALRDNKKIHSIYPEWKHNDVIHLLKDLEKWILEDANDSAVVRKF